MVETLKPTKPLTIADLAAELICTVCGHPVVLETESTDANPLERWRCTICEFYQDYNCVKTGTTAVLVECAGCQELVEDTEEWPMCPICNQYYEEMKQYDREMLPSKLFAGPQKLLGAKYAN